MRIAPAAVVTVLLILPMRAWAQADSARPDSARSDSVRPDSARRDGARPDSIRPDSARPDSQRKPAARPPAAAEPPVHTLAAGECPSAAERAVGDALRRFAAPQARPPVALAKPVLRDPSLRQKQLGRELLRLLHHNAIAMKEWPELMAAVPPHCTRTTADLARQYAESWVKFEEQVRAAD